MAEARYSERVVDGVPVVATPEEIDLTTADQLCAALRHAAAGRRPVLVVDMTGTHFCDSAGLHVLIAAHKRAKAEGGELRLVIPAAGTVQRVFTLTGVDRSIPCFAHLAEALAGTACPADSQAVPQRGTGQSQS